MHRDRLLSNENLLMTTSTIRLSGCGWCCLQIVLAFAAIATAVSFLFVRAAGGATLHPACPPAHGPFASSVVVPQMGRVVCLSDVTPNKYELWSVTLDGSSMVRLSQALADDRDVIRYVVSPFGDRVAFTADPVVWTQYELYSAPTSGSLPAIKHSEVMTFNEDADDFLWSLDGARLVYRKGHNAQGDWALLSSPCCQAGASVRLSQAGGQVKPGFQVVGPNVRYEWGNDGSTFLWWLVPVAGGTPQRDSRIFNDGFEGGNTNQWH